MPRYFIEVAYEGTRYKGFQVQANGNTIQSEITRALKILFKKEFELTGSSRTDAGVHARQNFFHVDHDEIIDPSIVYNLNALLPYDIVIRKIYEVPAGMHSRFNALSRIYHYHINRFKDPFSFGRSYYYPFAVNIDMLHEMAEMLKYYNDFTPFSKKNTQVKTFRCNIKHSQWIFNNNDWRYEVKADRFLRGMVKGLVATMLRIAKNNESINEFSKIFEQNSIATADFSVPSEGLFLMAVEF